MWKRNAGATTNRQSQSPDACTLSTSGTPVSVIGRRAVYSPSYKRTAIPINVTIRTKRDFWKIPVGYLFCILIAVLPILMAMSAGYIGELLGCTVNEAGAHPCTVLGVNIGELLSVLFVFGWLALITLPLGALLLLVWTLRWVRDVKAYYQRSRY